MGGRGRDSLPNSKAVVSNAVLKEKNARNNSKCDWSGPYEDFLAYSHHGALYLGLITYSRGHEKGYVSSLQNGEKNAPFELRTNEV